MPMTMVPYYIVTVGSHPFCLLDFVTSETKISSLTLNSTSVRVFFFTFWVPGIVIGMGDILVTMTRFLFFEKCAALIEIGMEVNYLNTLCNA